MPRSTALRAWYRSGLWSGGSCARSGREYGLDALLRQPRAEGVAVLDPVGNQAGQRRIRPGSHQGPGLGAVAALAARGDPLGYGSWYQSCPGYARGRDPHPFVFGCAHRAHVRALNRAFQPQADRCGSASR